MSYTEVLSHFLSVSSVMHALLPRSTSFLIFILLYNQIDDVKDCTVIYLITQHPFFIFLFIRLLCN